LTDAGRVFLREARAVLERTDEAVKNVRAFAQTGETELHVGYSPLPGAQILPIVLRAFQQAMPDVHVRLHDWSSDLIVVVLADAVQQSFVGLTREDYPDYHGYLATLFASVKNKPQVIEEHDGMTSVVSAVEAGTGVAVALEAFSYTFGNRVKLVRLTPEPKPISFGIAARKGRLSPATEKFWQCAKGAAASIGVFPKK